MERWNEKTLASLLPLLFLGYVATWYAIFGDYLTAVLFIICGILGSVSLWTIFAGGK